MIKAKIRQTTFDVNEEERTVKCILRCTLYANNRILDFLLDEIIHKFGIPWIYGTFEVEGTAKCHKNDIFSETVGKKIAESKAKIKLYNKTMRIMDRVLRLVDKLQDEFIDSQYHYYRNDIREVKHLYKLCKDDANNN